MPGIRIGKLRLGCRYSSNFAIPKITKFIGLLVGAFKSTVLLANFINFICYNVDSVNIIFYFCSGNSSNITTNYYFMKKNFQSVIQVLPVVFGKIMRGRFDVIYDGVLYHGYSKESVFALLGASVSCVQLVIPFVFD